jgi:hypothetical protein
VNEHAELGVALPCDSVRRAGKCAQPPAIDHNCRGPDAGKQGSSAVQIHDPHYDPPERREIFLAIEPDTLNVDGASGIDQVDDVLQKTLDDLNYRMHPITYLGPRWHG